MHKLTLCMSLLATAVVSANAQAADPEPPAPSRETPATQHRWGLVIGGGATFLASYGVAAAAAGLVTQGCAASDVLGGRDAPCDPRPYMRLVIPLVGPFTYAGEKDAGTQALILTDGALQVAGATLAIVGLVWTKPAGTNAATRPAWTPIVGNRSVGVAGTF
jgi:hypothetical protein